MALTLHDVTPGELGFDRLPNLRWVIAVDNSPAGFAGLTDWSGPTPVSLCLPPMEADVNRPGIVAYSSGTIALPKGTTLTRNRWDDSRDVHHSTQGYAQPDIEFMIVDPTGASR